MNRIPLKNCLFCHKNRSWDQEITPCGFTHRNKVLGLNPMTKIYSDFVIRKLLKIGPKTLRSRLKQKQVIFSTFMPIGLYFLSYVSGLGEPYPMTH